MTLPRSKTTRFRMLAVLALASSALSACTTAPAPTPTPTAAFASEDEAFAAAEETYRAYNDAGNARRNGEAEPDPHDFLTGTALEGDIDALNTLDSAGLHLTGEVKVSSFAPLAADLETSDARVEAIVCLDVTDTRVTDENGNDATPADRALVVAQVVTFLDVRGTLMISMEDSAEDEPC